MSDIGRHAFGFAAIVLGLVGMFFGQLAGVWQPMPDVAAEWHWFPYAVAAAFLIAGVAVQWSRGEPAGGFVLAALYGLFAGLWVKRILLLPFVFGTWGGFAEELSLLGAALLLAFRRNWAGDWSKRPTLDVLRVLFGICAMAFGLNHFFNMAQTAAMVPSWIPPNQPFWALATGIADVAAGLAIIFLIQARLAARLLTVMFASYSACIWIPALLRNSTQHDAWAGNAMNFALVSAAWVVADALAARATGSARVPSQ